MADEKQRVWIPTGGGLEVGPDEALLQPPKSRTANEVVVRRQGAYRKRPGATSIAAMDDTGVLVTRGDHELVYMGLGGTTYLGRQDKPMVAAPLKRSNVPCTVSAVPVRPVNGDCIQATVGHNAGYTMSACSVQKNVTFEHTTVWVLTDRTGAVLASYETGDVNVFPRVEAVTISSVPYFVLFGLDGEPSSGAPNFTLKTARVNATSPPGSLTWNTVGTVNRSAGTTTTEATGIDHADTISRFLYDTHSDVLHDKAYCVYYDGTNTVARSTDGNTVGGAVTVVAGSTTAIAIFHHKASETVLVYGRSATSVYRANSALSSFSATGSAVDAPHPIWYMGPSNALYMDGMLVTITGSNPGTPSFSGSRAHTPPGKTFDPANQGFNLWGDGNVVFFTHESSGFQGSATAGVFSDSLKEHSYINAVVTTNDGGSRKGYTVVPLLQTRHQDVVESGKYQEPTLAYAIFVQPQSASDKAGRVFLPMICTIQASPNTAGKAGGVVLGEQYLGYLVLDFRDSALVGTEVPHQESLITAVGNVSMWDGIGSFDLLGPPRILGYDDGNPPAVTTGVPSRGVYSNIHVPGSELYSGIGWWSMRVVLVYTDRNGIEYRSAPSNRLSENGISNNTLAISCPIIEIELDDNHRRIYEAGGSFTVELYTTERDATDGSGGAASEAAIVYDYLLTQRTPLLFAGTAGIDWYIPDFLTSGLTDSGNPVSYTKPLYTDQGELAPVVPPASNILASSGRYHFLVPSEFPRELWPSKPVELGRGPEWSPELILSAPAGAGNILSLAGQGDRLLLLCENGVWELFVGGGGPDANGAGSFGEYRNLVLGDGCVSHKGTCTTPDGVFYVARSGPKLVRPDGNIEDIGASVRSLVASTGDPSALDAAGAALPYIKNVAYNRANREVWLFQSHNTLVYSTKWATWTRSAHLGRDAVAFRNDFYWVHPNTALLIEAESAASIETPSDTFDVLPEVTTSWLSFDGPGGYQRCKRVTVVGTHISGTVGDIVVSLYYDFQPTAETHTFSASTINSADRKFSLRVKPGRQKFQSLAIGVSSTGSGNTHVWSLLGVELEMAPKIGNVKLQPSVSG